MVTDPLLRSGAMADIVPLADVAPLAVEALLDHAFGLDRHQRTAYKVRGNGAAIAELSFAAMSGGLLVGTIQCWRIILATDAGPAIPLVMVGPVAVEPRWQQGGIGRTLMTRSLEAADANGFAALMLIGDPEYYGRFFGFAADRTGAWRLPGPVEMRRLLARGAGVPDAAGMLGPA